MSRRISLLGAAILNLASPGAIGNPTDATPLEWLSPTRVYVVRGSAV